MATMQRSHSLSMTPAPIPFRSTAALTLATQRPSAEMWRRRRGITPAPSKVESEPSEEHWGIDEIKTMVEEILGHGPKTDPNLFQAAVILLSCTAVGPNADRITKFTGYDRDKVRKVARRIRKGGIWCGRGSDSAMDIGPWLEEDGRKGQGDLAFMLDAMVANGECDKVGETYNLTPKGRGKARTATRRRSKR